MEKFPQASTAPRRPAQLTKTPRPTLTKTPHADVADRFGQAAEGLEAELLKLREELLARKRFHMHTAFWTYPMDAAPSRCARLLSRCASIA
jgi:hypothetical protein